MVIESWIEEKGYVISSTIMENSWGQQCISSVPACRPKRPLCEDVQVKPALLSKPPKCWNCQNHRISTKEREEPGPEREVCCSQPNWKELEIWGALTLNMKMQSQRQSGPIGLGSRPSGGYLLFSICSFLHSKSFYLIFPPVLTQENSAELWAWWVAALHIC